MVLTEQEVKDLNVMDPFDQEWFGKMLHAEILSIIRLANYLQIPRLLDNSCKFVAREFLYHSDAVTVSLNPTQKFQA